MDANTKSVGTAAFVASIMPVAGQYAPTILFATLGALFSLMHERPLAQPRGILFMAIHICAAIMVSVTFAIALTKPITNYILTFQWVKGLTPTELTSPIALFIGGLGDKWYVAKDWLVARFARNLH